MSQGRNFVQGRRGVLAALCGLGASGLALGLGGASRQSSSQDKLAAINRDFCMSPSSLAALRLDPAALPKNLTLVGSRLLKLGFLDEIAHLYGQRSGNRVRIIGGGCDDGLIATRLGKAHMGELCCPIEGSPASGMCWLPVAQDIKVVLTSPDNPVDNITLDNLRRVAAGEILNWRELGGGDWPIALIVHNHCPPYMEPVRSMLLKDKKTWSKSAMRSKTDSDHLRHLARFRPSIGVDSWVLAAPYVKRGQLKTLRVNGVFPNVSNVARGAYPLHGPLNLIFALWVDDLMRPFLDFLYSSEGQRVIAKNAVPVPGERARSEGSAPEYVSASVIV